MAVSPGGRPMDTSPFSTSTTDNWVARTGGLNTYIRGVAHALLRTGRAKDESQAISMAVAAIKRWAAGRDNVRPQVQAAAAAALADWNAKRAAAHSHANDTEAVELAFDEALHPRVGAGQTGGGRFTAGQGGQQKDQQQPKKRKRGQRKMHGPAPMRPPAGPGKPPLTGRAAQARNLRTRATALRTQADGLDAKANALAKSHPSSAPKSAAAKARAVARKKNLPVHHTTKHAGSKKKRGPSIASRVTNLRTMAKALRTRAAILDHRAGVLSMAAEGPAVELAGTPYPETTAGRKKLAGEKKALSDGTAPIPDLDYLKRAIKSKGRVDPSKWAALAALIRKRAKELGAENAPGVKGTWPFAGVNAANGGPAVDLAGSVPRVASGDGPRVTTMGGSKNAKAVGVYRKLRAKGMKHGQALAMARRAASMKAKAA